MSSTISPIDRAKFKMDGSLFNVHLFYFILLSLLTPKMVYLFSGRRGAFPWSLVEVLFWLSPDNFFIFQVWVVALGFGGTVLCAFFPWVPVIRVAPVLFILAIVGLDSSFGKVTHGYYGWLFAALALLFLPARSNENFSGRLHQVLFCAKFSAILCYAMAGLWKIRIIPFVVSNYGWSGILHSLGNTIAYEHVYYSHSVGSFALFFIQHDFLTTGLFLGLIALQAGSPIMVFFEKTHFALGVLLALFHILSEVILNIAFRPQLYLILLFFVSGPALEVISGAFQQIHLGRKTKQGS